MKTDFLSIAVGQEAEAGIFPYATPDDELKSPVSSGKVLLATQVHGTRSVWMGREAEEYPGEADALICSTPGIAVGVRTADCVPILIFGSGVVAAVHAGWRGSLDEIGKKTIQRISRETGLTPAELRAYIGPHICADCYEVDAELADEFVEKGFEDAILPGKSEDKRQLDLTAVNKLSLISAGILPENITCDPRCTCCGKAPDEEPLFPSWRRNPGTQLRLVTFIALR